jgi:type VI secretion system secreted protein Hcp
MAITQTGGGASYLGTMGSTEQKGQVDSFLKIDGIQGDATADGHKNEIELTGWHFGGTNMGGFGVSGPGGGGGGKVQVNDFVFTMYADKSSPKLFECMATGKHIPKAVLTVRKAGGTSPVDFLKVDLEKVLVSSFHTTGNGLLPSIEVALNFAKIEFEFKAQNDDGTRGGSVKSGFDLQKGTKV